MKLGQNTLIPQQIIVADVFTFHHIINRLKFRKYAPSSAFGKYALLLGKSFNTAHRRKALLQSRGGPSRTFNVCTHTVERPSRTTSFVIRRTVAICNDALSVLIFFTPSGLPQTASRAQLTIVTLSSEYLAAILAILRPLPKGGCRSDSSGLVKEG